MLYAGTYWLFDFQLKDLDDLSPKFRAHAKSVDTNDPIPPVQVPRGYGGTAILYKKNWDIKVDAYPDGCDRINVLALHTDPKICIINVYMPCRGNNSKDTYLNTLSQVEEILYKFNNDHAVFICGDFNASLSRTPLTKGISYSENL